MAEAIGQSLPFAVAVALSPFPIVAVVLMLATPRALPNGTAFVAGWLAGLAAIGVIVLVIAGPAGAGEDGEPATWMTVLRFVVGVLFLFIALREWRGRPRDGEEPPLPKWMGAVDDSAPGKAFATGVALSALNPKNLLLTVGAAAAIAQTGIPGSEQAVAYAVFMIVATASVAALVIFYAALGERSDVLLGRLKDWMAHNNSVIIAVIALLIGAKLIGDAISGF